MPLLLLDTCKGTSVKDLNDCLPWPLKSLKHSSPLLSAMSPGLRLGHGRVASTTCHSRRSTVSPLRLPAESDHAKLVFLSCLQRTIKTKKSTKEKISEASACHWLHRRSIDPCPRELVSLFTTEDPRLPIQTQQKNIAKSKRARNAATPKGTSQKFERTVDTVSRQCRSCIGNLQWLQANLNVFAWNWQWIPPGGSSPGDHSWASLNTTAWCHATPSPSKMVGCSSSFQDGAAGATRNRQLSMHLPQVANQSNDEPRLPHCHSYPMLGRCPRWSVPPYSSSSPNLVRAARKQVARGCNELFHMWVLYLGPKGANGVKTCEKY